MKFRKGDTRMIIHSHIQHLPADAPAAIAPISGHPMAGPLDLSELLGINVDQITWPIVLVSNDRFSRIQIT